MRRSHRRDQRRGLRNQLAASLEAFARRDGIGEEALRVDTIYDKDLGHFQIMLFGGVNSTAAALKLVAALTEK